MWELIRANRRKSFILFIGMGMMLLLLGFVIGYTIQPQGGGPVGVVIASIIWVVLMLISYSSGSKILLQVSNAKEVTPEVHPQLFNVVEEMKIAANMPAMPKVYIINSEAPNAFATGKDPKNSVIAVTAGLLSKLNRDELQGVVAHETGHIINRDIRFVTQAGIMLGTIVLISEVFLRGMFYSSLGRSRSSRDGGGQGQLIIMIIAIAFSILAPIMAQLLYFAISRKREYLADATAARLTRYPEGLASALEKIADSTDELKVANKVTAPLYIINPLRKKGRKAANLTSTHPPINERIRILRNMAGGANYIDYQAAFDATKGKKSRIIPKSGLDDTETIPLREKGKTSTGAKRNIKEEKRNLGDLMMAVDQFVFVNCTCGMRLKVPPEFKNKKVQCPKCGRIHDIQT